MKDSLRMFAWAELSMFGDAFSNIFFRGLLILLQKYFPKRRLMKYGKGMDETVEVRKSMRSDTSLRL